MSALQLSHEVIRSRLRRTGIAVDATAGNGHDTLFLARHVGPGGRVEAFDIDAEAITSTRQRLEAAGGDLGAVTLHACGHERAAEILAAIGISAIDAVMFNLGYRPGGDKTRITAPETTVAALASLAARLGPAGVITAVAYVGHAGGADERDAVLAWAAQLPTESFAPWHYRPLHRGRTSPELIVVERLDPKAPDRTYL